MKLRKKTILSLSVAALAAGALTIGGLFAFSGGEGRRVEAETVIVSEAEDFVTSGDGTVLEGLSPEALGTPGDGDFYVAVIPASVKRVAANAFAGDTRLKSVRAAENSALEEIGEAAFDGCASLASADLPDRVTTLGANAFRNCAALSFVYLPDNESVHYAATAFDGCGNFLFVFDGYDAFLRDSRKISAFGKESTYPVSVNFHAGEQVSAVQKLHNRAYQFTCDEFGVWAFDEAEEASILPNMEGYSHSVYYYTPAFDGADATVETVTQRLSAVGVSAIDLYGYMVEKPRCSLSAPLVYNGSMRYLRGENGVLEGDPITAEMRYTLSYTDNDGTEFERVDTIQAAGTYTVTVNLDSAFGQWEEDAVFAFEVERQTVDLGNYAENLNWRLASDNSELREGGRLTTLYIYKEKQEGTEEADNAVREIPFLTPLSAEEIEQNGYTFVGKRDVLDSIVRFNDLEQSILLDCPARYENYDVQYVTEDGFTNRATSVGVYTVAVDLRAKNNYSLDVLSADGQRDRGLEITLSENGREANVTKVWYVVKIANGLLKEGVGKEPYSISDWVHGDEAAVPSVPVLEHGDAAMSFTLVRNGVTVGRSFSHNDFTRYFNRNVPTGEYTLNVSVGKAEELTDEGASVSYEAFAQTFHFRVTPRTTESNEALQNAIDGVKDALQGETFSYRYDGKLHFYDEEAASAIKALTSMNVHKQRGSLKDNVWASSAYDGFYTNFEVTMNLARMQNDEYRSLSAFSGSEFAPVLPDRYVVYYRISAPGFIPLVSETDSSRTEYFFAVDIYEEIGFPQIEIPVYDGNFNVPVVAENSRYVADFLPSRSNCDEVGSKVALTFSLTLARTGYDNGFHYRWALDGTYPEGITDVKINGETATFTYEIPRAENRFLVTPNINGWGYDAFSSSANSVAVSLLHGDVANVRFSVLDANGEDMMISGATPLTKFSLAQNGELQENGKGGYVIPSAVADYLNALPAGTYYLKAELDGNPDWSALDNGADLWEFRISPAKNFWRSAPKLDSWSWGNYDAAVNVVGATPAYGAGLVRYWICAANGDDYDLLAGEDVGFFVDENGAVPEYIKTLLASLDSGTYYLVAAVEGTSNYEGINEGGWQNAVRYPFTVNKLTTQWEETPNIAWWYATRYDAVENALIGKASFGEIKYVFFDGEGKEVAFEELGNLPEGTYSFRATVEGDKNHTSLSTTVEFKVLSLGELEGSGFNPWFIVAICLGVAFVAGGAAFLIVVYWKKRQAIVRTLYKAKVMRSTALITPPAPRGLMIVQATSPFTTKPVLPPDPPKEKPTGKKRGKKAKPSKEESIAPPVTESETPVTTVEAETVKEVSAVDETAETTAAEAVPAATEEVREAAEGAPSADEGLQEGAEQAAQTETEAKEDGDAPTEGVRDE